MRLITILLIVFITSVTFGQQIFKKKKSLLGSPFEITVIAKDSIQGNQFTELAISEVKRIENLIRKAKENKKQKVAGEGVEKKEKNS